MYLFNTSAQHFIKITSSNLTEASPVGLRLVGLVPCSVQCWHGPKAPKLPGLSNAARANCAPYLLCSNTTTTQAVTANAGASSPCQECKQKQMLHQQQQFYQQQYHQQHHHQASCMTTATAGFRIAACTPTPISTASTHGQHAMQCRFSAPAIRCAQTATATHTTQTTGAAFLPTLSVPPPPIPPRLPSTFLQPQVSAATVASTSSIVNNNNMSGNNSMLLVPFSLQNFVPMPMSTSSSATQATVSAPPQLLMQSCQHAAPTGNVANSNVGIQQNVTNNSYTANQLLKPATCVKSGEDKVVPPLRDAAAAAISVHQKVSEIFLVFFGSC